MPRAGREPIPLGFTVRCEEFTLSYYEGSDRPREYRSVLTVIDNGQEVIKNRPVIVNDPLTYKGITFYQSSYQPAGDGVFQFIVKNRQSGQAQNVEARFGQAFSLPGGGSFRVYNAEENPKFGILAKLEITTAAGERKFTQVATNAPDLDALRGGEDIYTLIDFKQRYFTGLQVAKDPGVWVVWLGCTMLVLGSMVAFFLSHRRIWVTLQPVGGKTGIKLGGSAHRNQPAFEIYFRRIQEQAQVRNRFLILSAEDHNMTSAQCFNITTIAYFAAMLLFIGYIATRSKQVAFIATLVCLYRFCPAYRSLSACAGTNRIGFSANMAGRRSPTCTNRSSSSPGRSF